MAVVTVQIAEYNNGAVRVTCSQDDSTHVVSAIQAHVAAGLTLHLQFENRGDSSKTQQRDLAAGDYNINIPAGQRFNPWVDPITTRIWVT